MTDEGVLLALDTAGPTAGVAVYRGQVLAEVVWQSGRRESVQLLELVDTALRLSCVEKSALGAVAVAAGPGSYSGLRVGLASATGLALALGIGIAQVPTLDCLAWGIACQRTSVRAAVAVGRGRYASARFRRGEGRIEQETAVESMGLGDLAEVATREQATLVVDLDAATRRQVEIEFRSRLHLAGPAASVRRAACLAELADLRIRAGEIRPGLSVEPIYTS